MNTEVTVEPNLVQKIRRKKNKPKFKQSSFKKFNKEGFLIAWGFAIFFAVTGLNIVWKTKSFSYEIVDSTLGFSSRHLVGFSPENTKETLLFLLGSLFIIISVFCIFLGLKIVAEYIVGKKLKLLKSLKKGFRNSRFSKLFSDKTSISK